MSKKIVRYEFETANLPPLTAKQKTQIAALRAKPDSEIDTRDIPELSDEFWTNTVRNPFYAPATAPITARDLRPREEGQDDE